MKQILILLLCFALLLSLTACQPDEPVIQRPVTFYYRAVPSEHGIADTVIAPVTAEGAGYEDDLLGLLNKFLKGTTESGLYTTFPTGTQILTMNLTADTAELLLNIRILRLSGADLTIACGCIAKTTMALTGVTTVRMRTVSSTLNGADELVMTADSLILEDLYTPETT